MNVGDEVQVGGTGPIMTIVEIRNTDSGWYAECVWFDTRNIEQRASYRLEALRRYVEPDLTDINA
ncbi:MAG: hypothetical protein OXQ89_19125 [Rhodospirillaceae bacterium]|nr:hypothetical protein [Rhodospirillaceae bacterium]MDD9999858.1 hypothetical protein [Rhodospirillaceae bacterium]